MPVEWNSVCLCPEWDSCLSQPRMAVFEDWQATTLTTLPPQPVCFWPLYKTVYSAVLGQSTTFDDKEQKKEKKGKKWKKWKLIEKGNIFNLSIHSLVEDFRFLYWQFKNESIFSEEIWTLKLYFFSSSLEVQFFLVMVGHQAEEPM